MTTMPATTIGPVLESALGEIRRRGMCKYVLRDHATNRVCAMGAVLIALGPRDVLGEPTFEPGPWNTAREIEWFLNGVVTEQTGGEHTRIVLYNNHDDTDQLMLESMFEKAIAAAYEEGAVVIP